MKGIFHRGLSVTVLATPSAAGCPADDRNIRTCEACINRDKGRRPQADNLGELTMLIGSRSLKRAAKPEQEPSLQGHMVSALMTVTSPVTSLLCRGLVDEPHVIRRRIL
jgi:hypothetical protein